MKIPHTGETLKSTTKTCIKDMTQKTQTASRFMAGVKVRLELAKAPKSLLISVSSLFTFIIKTPEINPQLILTGLSVFVLASGAATLNNYQDRHLDSQMQRTRNRPLPSSRISPRQTIIQAVFLLSLGLAGLSLAVASPALPLLGAAAIVAYNFIYTPLKTISLLAILPGAVCGMLPPCIGWLAAGGKMDSITLWSIMAIFGLWQLPHFWLILLLHPEDYVRSKVPSMLHLFSPEELRKVLFNIVMVFAISTLTLPLFNAIVTGIARWFILLNAYVLVGNFAYQFFFKAQRDSYKSLLVHLNAALVLMMSLGALDRLLLYYS